MFRRVLITLGQNLYYSLVILVMSGKNLSGEQSRKRKKNAGQAAKNPANSSKPFSKKLSQTNLSQKTMISWLSLLLTRPSNNRKGILHQELYKNQLVDIDIDIDDDVTKQ